MDSFDHEFVGLFFGEGNIDLGMTTRGHFYPRVRVSMSAWERPMLEAIQQRYGGSISKKGKDASITWSLTGKDNVRAVCDLLLASELPSPKKREAELLSDALDLIGPRGTQYVPGKKERMMEIRAELKACRFGGRNRPRKLSRELGV